MKTTFLKTLILSLSFTLFLPNHTYTQVEKKWEKPRSSAIHWQHVTYLGNLIVCTRKTLEGVDTETGDIR